MANIFTLDGGTVSCCTEENFEITEEYVCTRAQFSAEYPSLDISNIRSIGYEPARNVYHINDGDNNVTAYASPEDNDLLSFINSNYAAIKTFVAAKDAEINSPVE